MRTVNALFFRDQKNLKLQFQTTKNNVLQVVKRQKKHIIKKNVLLTLKLHESRLQEVVHLHFFLKLF